MPPGGGTDERHPSHLRIGDGGRVADHLLDGEERSFSGWDRKRELNNGTGGLFGGRIAVKRLVG